MSGQTKVVSGKDNPCGCAQITSLSSAVGLGTIPANAARVLLQAESQNVRWRDDGTDPTASVGTLIYAGQLFEYTGTLSAIKFIEAASGGKLNVSYYG